MVVGTLDEGFGRGIPAAAVLEVEDHGGIGRGREGVFVQADALGGGQLHVDAIAVEPRGVIAGRAFSLAWLKYDHMPDCGSSSVPRA